MFASLFPHGLGLGSYLFIRVMVGNHHPHELGMGSNSKTLLLGTEN